LTATFTIGCHSNGHLPSGGGRLDAILEIASSGTGVQRWSKEDLGGEVIILDMSASMAGTKLRQAADATVAAIGCLREGVPFAVIAGNERAKQVYPTSGLAPATPGTRIAAARAVRRLRPGGGTAMGQWLSLATLLLYPTEGIRHAILLTDGRDEHESVDSLSAAVEAARGVFQCDCRGVGTDWRVEELREIADSLLGTLDIVADPSGLGADFTEMMRRAMERTVADVRIRVWTAPGCQVVSLKQVSPDLLTLLPGDSSSDGATRWYPTGAWGDELRELHLGLDVRGGSPGERLLAARVTVVADDRVAAESLVSTAWTEEGELAARIDPRVAHYRGQQELAEAIWEGLDARRAGAVDTATEKLGLAVKLADACTNVAVSELLDRIVDVDDRASGIVRLRKHVHAEDEMALDTRSTRTVRSRS
jgi:hypothetical protein